jgi:hypothetical protein
MARQADRHATGPQALSPLLGGTLALVALAAVAVEAGAQAGAAIDHWRHRPPVDPLALLLELADGRTRWPPAGTPLLIAAAAACALIVIGSVVARARRRSTGTGADRAARLLGTGRSLRPISWRNAQATAKRFGVEQPGLPIARAVAGGQTLYATWEDMQCDIWGPRKGKSSSRAIPTLLAAPAAAFATSNKPDLYAATRLVREQGGRVWNFDPEAIAAGEADWWWNPLSYATSDRRALELTDAFVGAYRDPDARPDERRPPTKEREHLPAGHAATHAHADRCAHRVGAGTVAGLAGTPASRIPAGVATNSDPDPRVIGWRSGIPRARAAALQAAFSLPPIAHPTPRAGPARPSPGGCAVTWVLAFESGALTVDLPGRERDRGAQHGAPAGVDLAAIPGLCR